MTIDLLGLTGDEFIAQARAQLPGGHGASAEIYRTAFSQGRLAIDGLALSAANAAAWREQVVVASLEVVRVVEEPGEYASTSKAILRTGDGYEIECVRIPMRIAESRQGPAPAAGRARIFRRRR